MSEKGYSDPEKEAAAAQKWAQPGPWLWPRVSSATGANRARFLGFCGAFLSGVIPLLGFFIFLTEGRWDAAAEAATILSGAYASVMIALGLMILNAWRFAAMLAFALHLGAGLVMGITGLAPGPIWWVFFAVFAWALANGVRGAAAAR